MTWVTDGNDFLGWYDMGHETGMAMTIEMVMTYEIRDDNDKGQGLQ